MDLTRPRAVLLFCVVFLLGYLAGFFVMRRQYQKMLDQSLRGWTECVAGWKECGKILKDNIQIIADHGAI